MLREDLGPQPGRFGVREPDARAGVELLPRVHERFPPIALYPADQQALDGASRRVAMAEKPSGKDPGVVEYEQVATAEELGQGRDGRMGDDDAGRSVEDEQARLVPLGNRLLGDLFGREIEVEQRHIHRDSVARLAPCALRLMAEG
jgi:hypothetical protein